MRHGHLVRHFHDAVGLAEGELMSRGRHGYRSGENITQSFEHFPISTRGVLSDESTPFQKPAM